MEGVGDRHAQSPQISPKLQSYGGTKSQDGGNTHRRNFSKATLTFLSLTTSSVTIPKMALVLRRRL